MALWQQVQNGELVDTSVSATSSSKPKKKDNLDKQDFLNLLVAQMKYQDPLEPQSNTEYVAQLATFTQVEATENMATTMEQLEANQLVGKTVIMCPTNSTTGEKGYVTGIVDYVMREGSNIYLSVDGALYNLDDLDTVADSAYMEAVQISNSFKELVDQLPDENHVSLEYKDSFAAVRKLYDSLTTYQKQFITNENKDALDKFLAAETKLNALLALQDAINGGNNNSDQKDEDNGITEDGDTTEKTDNTNAAQ